MIYVIAAILFGIYVLAFSIAAGVSNEQVLDTSNLGAPLEREYAWRIVNFIRESTYTIRFTGSTALLLEGNVTISGGGTQPVERVTGLVIATANPLARASLASNPASSGAIWYNVADDSPVTFSALRIVRMLYYQQLPLSVAPDDPVASQLGTLVLSPTRTTSSCITLEAPFLITGLGPNKPEFFGGSPPFNSARNGFWGILAVRSDGRVPASATGPGARNIYVFRTNRPVFVSNLDSTMKVYNIK